MYGVSRADGKRPQFPSLLRYPTTRYYRTSLVDRGASFCSLFRPQDALATSPVTRTKKLVLSNEFFIQADRLDVSSHFACYDGNQEWLTRMLLRRRETVVTQKLCHLVA